MEFFFAWIVFGCAAASFAKGKNRNVALWAGIGLLLGPFAILILLVMKPAPGKEQDYD